MLVSPVLYVSSTPAGRGVFTSEYIPAKALFESAPALIVPSGERDVLDTIILHDYYFEWGEDFSEAAIALGFGSLYNHSYTPNAQYFRNLVGCTIDFVALRNIEPNEEITVNYNGDPDKKDEVWFPVL